MKNIQPTKVFIFKSILTLLAIIAFTATSYSQHLWYENETDTNNIEFLSGSNGIFTTNASNPKSTNINNNAIVSQFVRNENASSGLTEFKLHNPINKAVTYTVTIKAYIDLPTNEVLSSAKRLRAILAKDQYGDGSIYKQLEFTAGQQWQTFNFVFESNDFPQDILDTGGYNRLYIGYANGQAYNKKITYYIDSISGTTKQVPPPIVTLPLWYENDSNTGNVLLRDNYDGSFTTGVQNPAITSENNNATVSKFVREANVNKGLTLFKLSNPITEAGTYTITLKAYIDLPTDEVLSSINRMRMILGVDEYGDNITYKQLKFTAGRQWQTFTFVFEPSDFNQDILNDKGYNAFMIGYGNGELYDKEVTYYIDSISGTPEQLADTPALHPNVGWMAGSWGATFPFQGGKVLNENVEKGWDLKAGAQELVDELPAVGHVFTNLSYFAHSHAFTLRDNANVNVAEEIHEDLVPSVKNQELIFDVLKTFNNSPLGFQAALIP